MSAQVPPRYGRATKFRPVAAHPAPSGRGPRPPLPSEVALYEEHHYARFDVKPGITGPWQVAGRNQITDFERVVALETHYIREWSLLNDLSILLRTVWVVAQMRGAADLVVPLEVELGEGATWADAH